MSVEDRAVRGTVQDGAFPELGELTVDLRAGEEALVQGLRPVPDRRRPTRGARVSWATPRPYLDVTPARTPTVGRPGGGRLDAAWRRAAVRRSVVGDVLAYVVVVGGVMLTLRGVPLVEVALATVVGAVGWALLLLLNRAYDVRRLGSGPEEFQAVMRTTWTSVAAVAVLAYTVHVEVPRRVVFVALPLCGLVVAIHRYVQRRLLIARRHRGRAMQRTLVVGDAAEVRRTVLDLADRQHHGFEVVGACLPAWSPQADQAGLVEVLGGVGDVAQVVVDDAVDVVIVVGSELRGQSLRRLSWALDRVGADLVVSPGVIEVAGPHVSVRPAAGLSLLHLEQPSRHLGRELGKAVLDRVLGAALLVAAAPVIAASAAAVALTSPGGALFRQTRVGVDGSTFTMLKLRTMAADAETRRTDLLGVSDRDGVMFKMHHDPRVTPVGRWLRRLSLDELPQLWNVVRGDMSLVGPRPPLPSEVARYEDAVNRRLRVRPGLTGLWQVSGRADLDWDTSVNLDLRYVDNWSLALDLQILWKTARAVLRGSGAY